MWNSHQYDKYTGWLVRVRTYGFLVAIQRLLPRKTIQTLLQANLSDFLRYRQGQVPERIEGYRTVAAVRAPERRFQLSDEYIDYFRIIHS